MWRRMPVYPQDIDEMRGFRRIFCRGQPLTAIAIVGRMIIIEPGNPFDPQPRALLEQSHALMQSLFPTEANNYLSLEALTAEHIRFFVAREGDRVLGTGALALMGDYGEIKSMFTDPDARGKGVASAILRALEDCGREAGLAMLRLETGTLLIEAHRLYERVGFVACGPFGDYEGGPYNLFYEKPLT